MRSAILFIFAFGFVTTVLRGQTASGDSGKVAPAPKLSFDFSHRMRYLSWDRGMRVDEGFPMQFTTNRSRLGLTWRPSDEFEIRGMLTNEFFNWIEVPVARKFNIDEVIFEHLYIRWKSRGARPVLVTVGRFDMPLGEGFVIMDGTPLDGSRTLYVNGVRADIPLAEGHKLTLFYLLQREQDDLLPILNDRDKPLTESGRRIIGAYYIGKYNTLDYEAYAIESEFDSYAEREFESSEALDGIHDVTIGARIVAELLPGVTGTIEGALQFGHASKREIGDIRRRTRAAHGNIAWNMQQTTDLPVTLRIGMYHYSYDMLDRDAMEVGEMYRIFWNGHWDPVLGRWPKWNESLVYTDGILPLPGYWTMMQAPFAEVTLTPLAGWTLRSSVQALSWPVESEVGPDRGVGTLLTAHLFWKPDLPLSAHAMLERMWYDGEFGAEDPSYIWGRLELMYRVEW